MLNVTCIEQFTDTMILVAGWLVDGSEGDINFIVKI